jgi:hypothetical protein
MSLNYRLKLPCSPISHHSDTFLLVSLQNKNHGLLRELPATGAINLPRDVVLPDHGGFPSKLIATSLAISK